MHYRDIKHSLSQEAVVVVAVVVRKRTFRQKKLRRIEIQKIFLDYKNVSC